MRRSFVRLSVAALTAATAALPFAAPARAASGAMPARHASKCGAKRGAKCSAKRSAKCGGRRGGKEYVTPPVRRGRGQRPGAAAQHGTDQPAAIVGQQSGQGIAVLAGHGAPNSSSAASQRPPPLLTAAIRRSTSDRPVPSV